MSSIPSQVPSGSTPLYINVVSVRGEYTVAVIASRPQIEKLATDLLTSLSNTPTEPPTDKPKYLLSLAATGLVPGNPETYIAFLLDTADGYRPKPWFGPMFGSWWALLLAFVGVIALVKVTLNLVL